MEQNNRRNFIKQSVFAGTSLMFLDYSFFSAKDIFLDESAIRIQSKKETFNLLFTGNLRSDEQRIKSKIKQSNQFLWLDNGNFSKNGFLTSNTDFHIAGLGFSELQLPENQLAEMLKKSKKCIVNSHLSWSDTYLQKHIKPYQLVKIDQRKIGVTAISDFNQAFLEKSSQEKLQNVATNLKQKHQCDLTICLVSARMNRQELIDFIAKSEDIDVVLIDSPNDMKGENRVYRNAKNEETFVLLGSKNSSFMGQLALDMSDKSYYLPLEMNVLQTPKSNKLIS